MTDRNVEHPSGATPYDVQHQQMARRATREPGAQHADHHRIQHTHQGIRRVHALNR